MNTSSNVADADLIIRWRAAIDDWEAAATGATSSITGGGAIRELEHRFSAQLSGRPTLSVGSGTAALVSCLIGAGALPGSEVVTSVLDWPSAADAIRLVGARPVFADVDPQTLTISPQSVATHLTRHTAAVIATHLLGIPADVSAIKIALPTGIQVIEDCAQAWGATLDGQAVGTLGDCAAFSLGPGKHLDAGEAGIAAFADDAHWQRAVMATQHRVRGLATEQPAVETQFSSRIHPFAAVLALHELTTAQKRLARRRAQVVRWVSTHDHVEVLGRDQRRNPAWWRVPVVGSTCAGHGRQLGIPLLEPGSPDIHPNAHEALARTRLVAVNGNG